MQLIEQKRVVDSSKRRHTLPLLASISSPDHRAKIAVIKAMPVKFGTKHPPEKTADYSSWNMPAQETGVIKCRDHEFW